MASGDLDVFVRQVRERSRENRAAVELLHAKGLHGNIVSILRQELDSLVRVIFLLSQVDRGYRAALIAASVNGQQWRRRDGTGRITDREMVDLSNGLFYWAKNVYQFGCAFIHLSSFHDYGSRDPMEQISASERANIASYLKHYHCAPVEPDVAFAEVITYLPSVFEKIARNLECYLNDLESDGDLT